MTRRSRSPKPHALAARGCCRRVRVYVQPEEGVEGCAGLVGREGVVR